MGALSMQVDAADAAPVSQSKASRVAAATKASGAGPKKSRDGMLALIHCKFFTAACLLADHNDRIWRSHT